MRPVARCLASAFEPRGPVAEEIADLWWLMLVLGMVPLLVFGGLLVGGLFRRRARAEEGFPEPTDEPVGGSWLLGGGVALPTLLLVIVFVVTVAAMRGLYQAPRDALAVEVIGHQWWWEVRYPEAGFVTANEVHVPVDRPVELRLTSADVVHSFWVPALGGKIDALPEDRNLLVLEADVPGAYDGRCAEFCGLQHALMEVEVVAEPSSAFEDWVRRQQEPAVEPEGAEASRGQDLFLARGCGECHTIRGTGAAGEVGPDLTHLAGRRTIGAGTLPNTAEHLAVWVDDPHQVKEGVAMPASDLTDEELQAVVAYLGSLE